MVDEIKDVGFPAPATPDTPAPAADETTRLTDDLVGAVTGNPRAERAQPPETGGGERHNWLAQLGRSNAEQWGQHLTELSSQDGPMAEAERQLLLLARGGGEVAKWGTLAVAGTVFYGLRWGAYGPVRSAIGALGTVGLAIPAGIESVIAHSKFGLRQLGGLLEHGSQSMKAAAAERATQLAAPADNEPGDGVTKSPLDVVRGFTPDAMALLDTYNENGRLRKEWGKCRALLRKSASLTVHPLKTRMRGAAPAAAGAR